MYRSLLGFGNRKSDKLLFEVVQYAIHRLTTLLVHGLHFLPENGIYCTTAKRPHVGWQRAEYTFDLALPEYALEVADAALHYLAGFSHFFATEL
jgi:hypothetical protein